MEQWPMALNAENTKKKLQLISLVCKQFLFHCVFFILSKILSNKFKTIENKIAKAHGHIIQNSKFQKFKRFMN